MAERLEQLRRFCDEEGRDFDDLLLVSQCTPGRHRGHPDATRPSSGIDIVDLMIFGGEQQIIDDGRRFLADVASKVT